MNRGKLYLASCIIIIIVVGVLVFGKWLKKAPIEVGGPAAQQETPRTDPSTWLEKPSAQWSPTMDTRITIGVFSLKIPAYSQAQLYGPSQWGEYHLSLKTKNSDNFIVFQCPPESRGGEEGARLLSEEKRPLLVGTSTYYVVLNKFDVPVNPTQEPWYVFGIYSKNTSGTLNPICWAQTGADQKSEEALKELYGSVESY